MGSRKSGTTGLRIWKKWGSKGANVKMFKFLSPLTKTGKIPKMTEEFWDRAMNLNPEAHVATKEHKEHRENELRMDLLKSIIRPMGERHFV